MSIKDPRMPDPRFAILAPVNGNEPVLVWHHNHRLYEYAASAQTYAKEQDNKHGKAIVVTVDPGLCEPYGLSPEESFMFAERMAQYWVEQMTERQKTMNGEGPAIPRPKKNARTKPKKRRRRQPTVYGDPPAPPAPPQGSLAGALGAFVGGMIVGGALGSAIASPSPPSPPSPPNTSMAPFSPFSPFTPFKK